MHPLHHMRVLVTAIAEICNEAPGQICTTPNVTVCLQNCNMDVTLLLYYYGRESSFTISRVRRHVIIKYVQIS